MSTRDITVGLRLTADGRGLVNEVRASRGEVERLGTASLAAGDEAERGFGKTRSAVRSISDQLREARQAVLGYVAAQATLGTARKLIAEADAYSIIQSRLKLVTEGTQGFAVASQELFAIAQRNRQAWDATAELFGRLVKSTDALNLSQARQLELTETIGQAMAVGGGSAESMRAALVQLGQGLAAGALRGEELNSVLEQAPRLAQAIADGMAVPVGSLKQLAEAGELTTEVIVRALESQTAKLKTEFESIAPTVQGAWTTLGNAVTKYIGEADQWMGASRLLAGSIKSLADNFAAVVDAALTLGYAVGVVYVAHLARAGQAQAARMAATVAGAVASQRAAAVEAAAALQAAQAEAVRTAAVLAEAQAQRALMAQMAIYGPARAAIERQVTAATVANTAATTALAAAQTRVAATATAAGLAARGAAAATAAFGGALALVGGPIGALTIAVGALFYLWQTKQMEVKLFFIAFVNQMQVGWEHVKYAGSVAWEGIKALAVGAMNWMAEKFGAFLGYLSRGASAVGLDGLASKFSELAGKMQGGSSAAAEFEAAQARLRGERDRAIAGIRAQNDAIADMIIRDEQAARKKAESAGILDRSLANNAKNNDEAAKNAKALEKAEKERLKTTLALAAAHNQAMKEIIDADERALKANYDAIKGMRERAEQYEFETTLIGLSNEAREQAIVLHELEAQKVHMTAEAYAEMQKRVMDALAAKQDRQRAFDAQAEAARQADQAAAEWQRASADIERSLTDALMRGFEGGKGWASNFLDTLKNLFGSLVLKPIIQPIAQMGSNMVMGMLGMGASGSAMAGGGSGVMGMLSNGVSAANLFGGGSGILNAANGAAGFAADTLGLGASLFGTGAAYTSALSGLGVGASQAAMLAAQTGSFGAAGLSATAAAAGGSSAGLASTLAAIPGWGWALGAIALLAGASGIFGGKPSNKAAGGLVDLGSGATSQLWQMEGDKAPSQQTLDGRNALLTAIGGYGGALTALGATSLPYQSVGVDVGERDGVQFRFDGGVNGGTFYGNSADEALGRLFRELALGAEGLDESVRNLLANVQGTAEEFGNFTTALVALQDYAAADPLTAAAEAADAAGRSAWQTWQQQGVDLRAALSAWDGSAAATAELATLTQSRYQLELALAQQIHAALASTSAMFANTSEEMRYGTLDQAEKYEYLRAKAVELEDALQQTLDPAAIESLAKEWDATARQAWQLLGEDERKLKIDEYEAAIAEVNALVAERLTASGGAITAERDATLPDSITAAIEAAMDRVATEFMAAASAMQDAAVTPVTVEGSATVTIESPAGSLDVEVALG